MQCNAITSKSGRLPDTTVIDKFLDEPVGTVDNDGME